MKDVVIPILSSVMTWASSWDKQTESGPTKTSGKRKTVSNNPPTELHPARTAPRMLGSLGSFVGVSSSTSGPCSQFLLELSFDIHTQAVSSQLMAQPLVLNSIRLCDALKELTSQYMQHGTIMRVDSR